MPRILPLVLLAALAPLAQARPFVSLTLENDFFAGFDRHYTSGLQLALLVDREELPGFVRALPPLRWSSDPRVVLAFGQRIYTPTDIETDTPDPADRPYAGWLYALADVQTRSGSVVDHVTTTVGIVGPGSLGRQTHEFAHRLFNRAPTRGWHAQLRNEPTLMVGYERAWQGVAGARFGERRGDISLRAGATVGTPLTYAHAGAVLRYGTHLPADLPATHLSLGPPRDGYRGAAAPFGWYAWLGVEARAVAHNVFVEGNTFRDGPGLRLEPFGADLQVGIVAVWPDKRLGFTVVQRSSEFEGQDKPDRYGQLAVSFAY